ncbi:hypothetical protein [Actinoplanes sp. G11-F43]|uniref:hypothetical protein n=1 Tax=Actinoplanes sp. G11-F43 TaxID=3424130 RepID=UPI003D32B1E8
MTNPRPPRILDASAVVALFAGHPDVMMMLQEAEAGRMTLTLPSMAVAEAQAVLRAAPSMWHHIFAYPGIHEQPLTWNGAIDAGLIAAPRLEHHPMQPALIGPIMVGQIVDEATAMNAVVVTTLPEAYGAYNVALLVLP